MGGLGVRNGTPKLALERENVDREQRSTAAPCTTPETMLGGPVEEGSHHA